MTLTDELATLVKNGFDYEHFELLNESHMHSVPPNSETHFKLTLVSAAFEGVGKVARHQMLYKLVTPLMQKGLHALALHTYTPDEWKAVQQTVPDSPNCHGGSK